MLAETELAEQKKKNEELTTEKTWLEEELNRKSKDLESAELKRKDLEGTVTTLQDDLNELTENSKILDKELLSKQCSFLFRHANSKKNHSLTFLLNHCSTHRLSARHHRAVGSSDIQARGHDSQRTCPNLPEHL